MKGSIELDKKGLITGMSSYAWNSLHLNPNVLIGCKIQDYIEGVESIWNSVSNGTLISQPFTFKIGSITSQIIGVFIPIVDGNRNVQRIRFLLYNVN